MTRRVPDRIAWAIEQLAVDPGDVVLEIGCGTGVAADLICQQLTTGRLTAIDRSEPMIAAAQRYNKDHIASGRAAFLATSLAEFSSPREHFDKALAINTNVFWQDSRAELQVLRRVLTPGGELCLVFQPPDRAKVRLIGEACAQLLAQAGFSSIAIEGKDLGPVTAICIQAKSESDTATTSE